MKHINLFISGAIGYVSPPDGAPATLGLGDTPLALLCAALAGTPVYAILATGDEEITPATLLAMAVDQANGVVSGEYHTYLYEYSELTSEERVDESGQIGGHDLLAFFARQQGTYQHTRYGALVLSTRPIDLAAWDETGEEG